jgi:hypothetical protein
MIIGYLNYYLFYKQQQLPYGHSLAHGMRQKVSCISCICGPAREGYRYRLGPRPAIRVLATYSENQ